MPPGEEPKKLPFSLEGPRTRHASWDVFKTRIVELLPYQSPYLRRTADKRAKFVGKPEEVKEELVKPDEMPPSFKQLVTVAIHCFSWYHHFWASSFFLQKLDSSCYFSRHLKQQTMQPKAVRYTRDNTKEAHMSHMKVCNSPHGLSLKCHVSKAPGVV